MLVTGVLDLLLLSKIMAVQIIKVTVTNMMYNINPKRIKSVSKLSYSGSLLTIRSLKFKYVGFFYFWY